MLKAGRLITVHPTADGLRTSYPAANWIEEPTQVRLLEDAPNQRTLDVLDVESQDGTLQASIYDFNID